MLWKHPASLTLLTLCISACGAPPDSGAPEAPAAVQEAPATAPGPVEAPAAPPGDSASPTPPVGNGGGGAGVPVSPPAEPRGPRILIVPKHYPTIQAAVDAAESGDTVHVAPGIYTEHVRLKSGIRLSSLGAPYTFLDARGASRSLIDFTGAKDVVITGFTFRNVGSDTWCTMSSHMDRWCSGNWYAAAVYADGHEPSSALIEHNIFDHNGIGVLLYFHARAELRGNLFFKNDYALTFPYFNDVGTVEGNIFWGNRELAIGVLAGQVDIRRNVIAGSTVGMKHMAMSPSHGYPVDIRCNLFFQNEHSALEHYNVPPRVVLGENDNVVLDPMFIDPEEGDFRLREDSPLKSLECLGDVSLDGMGPVAL